MNAAIGATLALILGGAALAPAFSRRCEAWLRAAAFEVKRMSQFRQLPSEIVVHGWRSGMRRVVSMLFVSGFMLVVAMSFAFTVHGQGRAAAPKSIKNPVAPTAASVTAGAAAYKKFCAYCHGAEGKGDGPLAPEGSHPPDLTDAEWVHGSADGEIFTVIANGVADSKMLAFKKKMPDQNIWHIINFLRSLSPEGAVR